MTGNGSHWKPMDDRIKDVGVSLREFVEAKLEVVAERVENIDGRLERIEETVDKRLGEIDGALGGLSVTLARMEGSSSGKSALFATILSVGAVVISVLIAIYGGDGVRHLKEAVPVFHGEAPR